MPLYFKALYGNAIFIWDVGTCGLIICSRNFKETELQKSRARGRRGAKFCTVASNVSFVGNLFRVTLLARSVLENMCSTEFISVNICYPDISSFLRQHLLHSSILVCRKNSVFGHKQQKKECGQSDTLPNCSLPSLPEYRFVLADCRVVSCNGNAVDSIKLCSSGRRLSTLSVVYCRGCKTIYPNSLILAATAYPSARGAIR